MFSDTLAKISRMVQVADYTPRNVKVFLPYGTRSPNESLGQLLISLLL